MNIPVYIQQWRSGLAALRSGRASHGTVLSDGRGSRFPNAEARRWESWKGRSREIAEKSRRGAGSARRRPLNHRHHGQARSHGDRCPPRPAGLFSRDGESGKRSICSHLRRPRSRACGTGIRRARGWIAPREQFVRLRIHAAHVSLALAHQAMRSAKYSKHPASSSSSRPPAPRAEPPPPVASSASVMGQGPSKVMIHNQTGADEAKRSQVSPQSRLQEKWPSSTPGREGSGFRRQCCVVPKRDNRLSLSVLRL